jgi:hypothetical protein
MPKEQLALTNYLSTIDGNITCELIAFDKFDGTRQ